MTGQQETQTSSLRYSKNAGIDIATEIASGKRCPTCKRKTNPDTDFYNIRKPTERTKLCIACRTSVRNSVRRKMESGRAKRPLTIKQKMELYEKIIQSIPYDYLKQVVCDNKLEMPEFISNDTDEELEA